MQRTMRIFGILLWLAIVPLSSCFVRTRVAALAGRHRHDLLLTASKDELIERVHSVSDPIESFLMKVEMSPTVGSRYSGELKDYPTIPGYVLFRKPEYIRIIGLDPVLHSRIFDMVSNGQEFRAHIPSKNQFIEGNSDAPASSQNKVENLRPVAFLTALLICPPDSETERTLLENDTNETEAVYILMILRGDLDQLQLLRNIYFDRYTLQIVRQKTFDGSGGILSDTRYSAWKTYSGIPFPSEINILRPQDNYEVALTIGSMKINSNDVTPDKFILNQPSGTQLRRLN